MAYETIINWIKHESPLQWEFALNLLYSSHKHDYLELLETGMILNWREIISYIDLDTSTLLDCFIHRFRYLYPTRLLEMDGKKKIYCLDFIVQVMPLRSSSRWRPTVQRMGYIIYSPTKIKDEVQIVRLLSSRGLVRSYLIWLSTRTSFPAANKKERWCLWVFIYIKS
jgi:hypothetical protein